ARVTEFWIVVTQAEIPSRDSVVAHAPARDRLRFPVAASLCEALGTSARITHAAHFSSSSRPQRTGREPARLLAGKNFLTAIPSSRPSAAADGHSSKRSTLTTGCWNKLVAGGRAKPPLVVIHKCVEGHSDSLPFRTVCPNAAAYWVGAKEVVGGDYCVGYTTRIALVAVNIELRC